MTGAASAPVDNLTITVASAEPTVHRDVVFAERLGFRPLSLDLHLPAASAGAGLLPVVVFVHGGGWRAGSRRVFCPGLTDERSFGLITAAGFALAAIDYRLSGEAIFPAPVEDVLAAIEWIGGDAASAYALDRSRVVLWGESAGAHLAALAALSPGGAGVRGVRGVVDWYGPADLTAMGSDLDPAHPGTFDDATDTREAGLLGGSPSALPERAAAASPALVVRPGSASPPFFLAHGTADTLVPFAQSAKFAAALEAAGVPVQLMPVPGASHFWRGVQDTDVLFGDALAFAHRVTAATVGRKAP